MNSLDVVLCRFRQESVTLMCDIEKKFYQFRVIPKYRDFFANFFWLKNGDFNSQQSVYRMTFRIFGATTSPPCASFGLKQAAKYNEDEFGRDVDEFIREDFYVDDGLKSLPNEEDAIDLIHRTNELCLRGGLRLDKSVSNSKHVIESVDIKTCPKCGFGILAVFLFKRL